MSDIGWIIIITAIAGVGGTGLGGVVGALLKRNSSRIVSLLLAFAGGIMTGVVCFDMITGALQPEGSAEQVNVFFVVAGVMLGYVVIWVLNVWIDRKTNHELDTWIELERTLNLEYGAEDCARFPLLRELREIAAEDTRRKLADGK